MTDNTDLALTDRARALAEFVGGWTPAQGFAFVQLAESTPTLADVMEFRRLVGQLHEAFHYHDPAGLVSI